MRIRIMSIPLPVIALAVTLAACGGEDDNTTGDSSMSTPTVTTGASTANATPTRGMDHGSMDEHDADVDPDLLFIDAMIVHHQSAVTMAEIAQEVSEREEIQSLASEIIKAQNAEIEQLTAWRDEWYPDAPESDMSSMMDMAGMNMTDADMQMLREAEDFDIMFIDMMIPHHEAAIEMAEALQETTERPELQQLAEDIITTQQAEIDQMREWREEWS